MSNNNIMDKKAEIRTKECEFVALCRTEEFSLLEDLINGIGWKLEKPPKQKGKKKNKDGDPVVPKILKGENPQNINIFDENRESPLYVAVKYNRVDLVKLLLASNPPADPNVANAYGYTPLYWAAENGNEEIVVLLLEAGADPNIASTYNHTPLSRAEKRQHKSICNLLLKSGAVIDPTENPSQASERWYLEEMDRSFKILIEEKKWLELNPAPHTPRGGWPETIVDDD